MIGALRVKRDYIVNKKNTHVTLNGPRTDDTLLDAVSFANVYRLLGTLSVLVKALKIISQYISEKNNTIYQFDKCKQVARRSTVNPRYIDITQRAHDVNTTSPQRRCNVMTLHRR